MVSQWSILLVLPALALATISCDRQTLGHDAPPSDPHVSFADKARRYFTAEELAKGRSYARGRYLLYGIRTALTLGLFGFLILSPLSVQIRDLSVWIAGGRVWLTTGLFGLVLALLYHAAIFPISLYGSFLREHTFGLSRQTFTAWVWDYTRGILINAAILLPLLILLYTFIRWDPVRWYLPVWVVIVLVMGLLAELSPILFDPLFHTFRPVQDQGLVERLRTLTERAGLTVGPILEIDASHKTTKTNAYFTGFGRTRRIVLYDTLLTASTPEEVELIVAHELGHWTRHHIWKGMAISAVSTLAALWLIARLLRVAADSGRFGFVHPADPLSLSLLLFLLLVITMLTTPIQMAISRSFEREADRESLRLTENPTAFIASEVTLARSNLADIDPPRAVVWLLYSHPPVLERIAVAEAFPAARRQ
ncbi:protease [Candidatus Methylomirabilis lanthanidiphila]|uniref:Protease n=1 Tax=Candidatus Methylomirabilis lanthanidiphila TaxID=2211376 RepID=A0A564ZH96_9BACT|nr:M48 family metallopeptidase [Candidatus Methylomirabilis lanthanidiphila]VUZ84710.1 protease [Candidatus Methylomirabilis lanthanidiphila]